MRAHQTISWDEFNWHEQRWHHRAFNPQIIRSKRARKPYRDQQDELGDFDRTFADIRGARLGRIDNRAEVYVPTSSFRHNRFKPTLTLVR
jgi:hypothetical protein